MKFARLIFMLALLLSVSQNLQASDQDALEKIGVKVTLKGGVIFGLRADCNQWTEADFRLVGKQTSVKQLHLSGKTLTDETLPLLSGLKNVESILINTAQVSDAGFKHFQAFSKLKQLSIYHHARDLKGFDGSGLIHLKPMVQLETLTFAGAKTGDVAMKAIGQLSQLKSYSQWHNFETPAGMKYLLEMKGLKSLRLGQRLYDWKPPAKPASFDEATFSILSEMKSLESLEIMEARLSYAALIQLKELPHLKKLGIRMVVVSEADIARLKKGLPKVAIKWTPLSAEEEAKMAKKLKI